eukprot:CAMPEP_0206491782 /NCGR_PEP_ID=MMETSP0324_2-20121206/45387_1 /ASSEMBLY_ACC=CAM_ASM_000836 /TAXON_ID=2866 /ORGANISM="Crypthecodinium cohnii, Strain Seligo" /LENGTH=35 /DNA_ID= /DNA_START= /DNA_END= /DNA_ORIENTATION=
MARCVSRDKNYDADLSDATRRDLVPTGKALRYIQP